MESCRHVVDRKQIYLGLVKYCQRVGPLIEGDIVVLDDAMLNFIASGLREKALDELHVAVLAQCALRVYFVLVLIEGQLEHSLERLFVKEKASIGNDPMYLCDNRKQRREMV